jgi:hypothetical protein
VQTYLWSPKVLAVLISARVVSAMTGQSTMEAWQLGKSRDSRLASLGPDGSRIKVGR